MPLKPLGNDPAVRTVGTTQPTSPARPVDVSSPPLSSADSFSQPGRMPAASQGAGASAASAAPPRPTLGAFAVARVPINTTEANTQRTKAMAFAATSPAERAEAFQAARGELGIAGPLVNAEAAKSMALSASTPEQRAEAFQTARSQLHVAGAAVNIEAAKAMALAASTAQEKAEAFTTAKENIGIQGYAVNAEAYKAMAMSAEGDAARAEVYSTAQASLGAGSWADVQALKAMALVAATPEQKAAVYAKAETYLDRVGVEALKPMVLAATTRAQREELFDRAAAFAPRGPSARTGALKVIAAVSAGQEARAAELIRREMTCDGDSFRAEVYKAAAWLDASSSGGWLTGGANGALGPNAVLELLESPPARAKKKRHYDAPEEPGLRPLGPIGPIRELEPLDELHPL